MHFPAFVCLWAWIWMKCCVSTDVGTWTNWLTFEPDPDYSPDVGTGLLSTISYVLQRGILLRRENPTYAYWRSRSLQRGVVLTRFYSPWAMGTPLSEVRALYRVPSSYFYYCYNQYHYCKSHQSKTWRFIRLVKWLVFIGNLLLSASLYVSKRGAYWDRLCRDVVGWLVVMRVHCGQSVHPRPIVTMEH